MKIKHVNLVENIFEQNDIELLQNIHIPTKNNSLFLSDHFVHQNPQFTKLVRYLNDIELWSKRIPEVINLESFHSLRMELIEDFEKYKTTNKKKDIQHKFLIDIDNNVGYYKNFKVEISSRVLLVEGITQKHINKWRLKSSFWYEIYANYRNRPELFEPEKWNKLDWMERDEAYDNYIDWCGGLYEIRHRKGNYIIQFDNVDILNVSDEDNLYKKIKAYILISRRWTSRGNPKMGTVFGFGIYDSTWTEKRLRKEMNDFKELILDNIEELISNLSGRWLFAGILLCFIDNGTDEEKFIALSLLILMLINRVNFKASSSLAPRGIRDIWSQQNYMMEEEKEFLINKVLPLTKKKDFESFVKEFIDVIVVGGVQDENEVIITPHTKPIPIGQEDLERHQLFPTLALLWNKEETSKFKNLFLKTLNEKLS